MKQVVKHSILIGLYIAISSTLTYYYGKRVQRFTDNVQRLQEQANEHYLVHAAQLTANDIPIWFEDEVPGMGGTKEKPVLCGAYYDSTKQSVILFTVKTRN